VRDLLKVAMDLRACEVFEHVVPMRLLPTIVAEVRRDLAAEHAHARGLADAVRSEEADDLSLLRDRDAEKPEGVLAVLVDEVFLERLGKADNPDRIERTFFYADPAADARFLADRRLGGLGVDPDDLRPGPLGRAESDAFEMAALRLTTVLEHDRDAHGNSMIRELFKRVMIRTLSAEPLSDSGPSIPM
jgi:hypothetical protein